ncbi:hypothetical protein GCM10022214_26770 [Actinomadura miaoliensis]|uniref:Helix-turn-helix domain-containing protein n=1 Tax=Actinomadura miaoliensis TaxID=430685 RepID=A0ABP7VN74_9ACTN
MKRRVFRRQDEKRDQPVLPPRKDPSVLHGNAPLSVEGRRRLVQRCQTRPIAHVAPEMGISCSCASKWVNRYRRFGEISLLGRPSATPEVIAQIGRLRRERKWSARRIALELVGQGIEISERTVGRHLAHLGLNRRRDPTGRPTTPHGRSSPAGPATWCTWTSKRPAASPTAAAGERAAVTASRPGW